MISLHLVICSLPCKLRVFELHHHQQPVQRTVLHQPLWEIPTWPFCQFVPGRETGLACPAIAPTQSADSISGSQIVHNSISGSQIVRNPSLLLVLTTVLLVVVL
ncbi:hypothetical protein ACSBR1_011193 [Camellia fascicularis]